MSGLVKRSFSLSGHRTSVALEAEFWTVLTEEAARPKIARANQIAAGLLILTVVAMVMARQL